MELKDISHNLTFSTVEKPGKTTNSDESIQSVGKERINSLKQLVGEIEFLILERERLSKQIVDETEKIKTEIQNFLLSSEAVDSEDFKERNGLRNKQIDISELQLNEKVNCWRDVALLKKELRERVKELNEKEERMAVFEKILY
ncbi:MAG TPA: hypothetical protein VJH92_02610 [Candidatus Nanoarchaeia archaeon]|nr:hypothetical protein [Candidatus Nanoarchaeia archaeon]